MNNKISYVPWVYLSFIILSLPFSLQAQDADANSVNLTLHEAIEIALEENFSLEQAEYNVDKTRAQYRQTNAVFLPQLSFEYNAISTDDPLNVFGFKLKQEVVGQQDFNPALLNDPGSYENYSAKLEVSQPLFNPDMFMQRSAMNNRLKSANEQLEGTKKHVQYQVRNQYYSLILHLRQLDVIESAMATSGEHRRQAQNYYEEGMIGKADFLAARVYELEMESRKISILNSIEDSREALAHLLGLEGTTEIIPSDSLVYSPAPQISAGEATANINNAQTRAIEYRVRAADRMVKSTNFSFLPKINLFGIYEYNDTDIGSFDASSYMIGANLRWNIFSGFSNAGKVMEAKADLHIARSMQKSHSLEQENKVREAIRSLEHAEQELALTEESIRQSTEDVKIRSNRYSEGMERTTDLLEAETKLAEAKLKNVMALYKYNMSIAALEMLLETNIKN